MALPLVGLLLVQSLSPAPATVELGAEPPRLLDRAWERIGAPPGGRFGAALAAGDVDGDGYEDLVVGSPGPGGPGSFGGRVELYRGGPAGLAEDPVWTREGGWPGARFGATLAVADVNGDGYDDVVVGAPDFDVPAERPRARAGLGQNPGPGGSPAPGSRDEGAVTLFLGNALARPTLRRVILGLDSGEHLGSAVADAGDVDGDGFADVLVGASGKDGNRGLVLLFHGTSSGLPALPAWWLPGTLAGKGFGTLLAGAGDQNGDGYGDFALGHTTVGVTRVVFYLGGPAGPVQHWIVSEDAPALAALELGDALEPDDFAWGRLSSGVTNGARVRSNDEMLLPDFTVGIQMGAALAGADVDGDGYDDLAASAPLLVPGTGAQGRVYVYRRGADGQETVPLAVLDGDQPGSGFGTVLAALDADGDGADELVIASPTFDAGAGGEGRVRVHRGDAGPFTAPPFPPLPFGWSLGAMDGDFDGDGYDDLFLTDSGVARVMRGSAAGPTGAFDGYTEILQPHGATVVEVADLDADGFDDVVYTTASCGNPCGNPPNAMGVYLGGSAGLASSASWYHSAHNSRIHALGDVDGDGYEELLLEQPGLDEVYFGTALGPAAVPGQTLDLGTVQALAGGDVDGDGRADLVVHRSSGSPTVHQYDIHLGSPGGLVPGGVLPVTGLARLPRRLPDVNGDGYADLPVSDAVGSSSGILRIHLGSPSGPVPGDGLRLEASGTSIRVAASDPRLDVDGDGREDVLFATSGQADNGASVQLGLRLHLGAAGGLRLGAIWGDEATAPFLGDTDGDGKLEVGYVSFAFGGRRFLELR